MMWWAKALALAVALVAAYWWGESNAETECGLAAASRTVEAYGAQQAAQARVDVAVQALADKQAVILQGVAIETIKYKVVYRDRIQDPSTARCVADSGLLELYRAAHGFERANADAVDAAARPGK